MAAAMSKRQQARNERMLQDLVRTVPGNDRCADCAAKNPAWASWNLGIFLCMRCAALHRKLGTHISKVKSLSMDSWTAEQVENMKKVGNVASNKIYNPRNVRTNLPIDVDEADMALEKYIRQKYDQRSLSTGGRPSAGPTRQSTGSTETGSWNDEPPPLPPKPGKRFGFSLRSSSSTVPRSKPDRFTPPLSPAFTGSDGPNTLPSPKKTTHLFGMRITTIENNFDAKLQSLREMGFPDNKKNTELLKSMNGNLDKTIDALARLGEGVKPISRSHTPAPRALTPVSMGSTGASAIHVEKRRGSEKLSGNPWEVREDPVTSAAQSAVTHADPPRSRSVPPSSSSTSWNPFLQSPPPPLPQQPVDLAFQNLQIAPPPAQFNNLQTQYYPTATASNNPWPVQSTPQRSQTTSPFAQQYQQPAPLQPSATGNPFFQNAQPPSHETNNPWSSQVVSQPTAPQQSLNPFGVPWQPQNGIPQQPSASPTSMYGPHTGGFAPPLQPATQQQPPQNFPYSAPQNPWSQQQISSQPTALPTQQQQLSYLPAQQHSYPPPQAPIRHDKSSILALYSQPQLAGPHRASPLQTLPENATISNAIFPPPSQPSQRSATMPMNFSPSATGGYTTNNNNPFTSAAYPPQMMPTQSIHHVSNESRDFQGLGMHGRHSPDAFSGLSARYMGS